MAKHKIAIDKAIAAVILLICVVTIETYPQYISNGSGSSGMTETSKFNCPETDQCHCVNVFSEFEIQCPRYDAHVTMIISPKSQIRLHCISNNDTAYAQIPQMNVGEVNEFRMQGCPLPVMLSLKSVVQKFNATKIRSFTYQTFSNMQNPPFHRQHFSGFQDLQRLVLSDSSETEFPADLFNDLENLDWLQLKSNRKHLPNGIFDKLTNVRVLEILMKLEQLEDGMFKHQKNLQTLALWGNELHNLTKDAFKDLPLVVDLDLNSNRFETFAPDVFENLKSLKNINLNGNYFTSLPEGLFEHNNDLIEFKLLNNREPLVTLPKALLANKKNLHRVYIRANVKYLPSDLFTGSSNISLIKLEQNELEQLPATLFADQEHLEELYLGNNKLTHLDDNLFESTRALRTLHLSHNQLLNISANLFSQLAYLTELYLDHNNLHTINHRAFYNTHSLETLHLQFNRLTLKQENKLTSIRGIQDTDPVIYSPPFTNLDKLKSLRLEHNLIEIVYYDWGLTLLSLEELNLSHNNITHISVADLQFLQKTIVVDLSNNQIATIDLRDIETLAENDMKMSPAKVLLNENPLNCDCIALELVRVTADSTKIKKFIELDVSQLVCSRPENLKGKHVSTVDPYDLLCPLDSPETTKQLCPENCECNVRLVDHAILVNCSNQGLTSVPTLPNPSTISMKHIELDMSHNHINNLPNALNMPGYNSVSKLQLDHNNLSYLVPENVPQNVKLLKLESNYLQWLNESVLGTLYNTSSLENLYLSDNPWKCSCDSREFFQFIRTQFKKISDYNTIECDSGEQLAEMQLEDFCSEDNVAVILVAIVVALLGVLIALAALLYMKYNQEIKVWLFAKGWCLWLIDEDDLDEDKKYDAFISFSQRDEELVAEYLVPELESGEYPYKLCIHFRDWMVGDVIADQVSRSVSESRKTIVVLSPNFLQSVWGQAEFRLAHQAAMKEGRARVIMIIYGDIGDIDSLDNELQTYLKTNTYLKWGDEWFWRKLRYALRHPISMRGNKQIKGLVKNSIKNSVDDKLELIIPSPVTPTLTTPPAESANNTIIGKINGNVVNQQNGIIPNGKINGGLNGSINGHVNGAFIINTNAKQSDV